MADYIRGRVLAAKVGVTMAFVGLLGGLAAKVRPQQPLDARQASSTTALASKIEIGGRIGTKQVKDHSLLYRDFKQGQVASARSLKNVLQDVNDLSAAIDQKVNDLSGIIDQKVNDLSGKIDQKVNDLSGKIDQKVNDLAATTDLNYLRKDATAVNAAKIDGRGIDQIVQGRGTVLTGVAAVDMQLPAIQEILKTDDATVTGTINAKNHPTFTIKNTSGADMYWSYSADGVAHNGTTKADGTFDVELLSLGDVATVLILCSGEPNEVNTLSLGSVPADGNNLRMTAQILIGL